MRASASAALAPSAADVAALMRSLRGVPAAQLQCCQQLRGMDAADVADGADAVSAVVTALRTHVNNLDVLYHGCVALAHLAAASVVNRRAAAVGGAVGAVAAAMHSQVHDGGLHCAGCEAFCLLATDAHVFSVDGAVDCALGAVAAACRAYPAAFEVQCQCYGVLRCLAVDGGGAHRTAVINAGGIELALGQVRACVHDVDLFHRWGLVLGSLYDHPAGRRALTHANAAIQAVVAALLAHPAHARAQAQGCFVLSHVLRHAPESRHTMIAVGGLQTILTALRAHPEHATVQRNACGALDAACLSGSNENAAAAVAGGAIATVTATLRLHAPSMQEEVQRAACCALGQILIYVKPDVFLAAGAAAAIEPLVAALRAYPANPFLHRHCAWALSRIILRNSALTQRAIDAGAIEAVLESLGALSDADSLAADVHSPSPYQAGCKLLTALMWQQEAVTEQRAVCAVGVIEDLVSVARGLSSECAEDTRVCARVLQQLHAAAARHDTNGTPCALDAAGSCKRCAAARECGALCALPGCSARGRPGGKTLARCAACRVAAYCGAAHQREHWPAHKPACRAAAAAAAAGQAAGADE
jgi:hypothetical protein